MKTVRAFLCEFCYRPRPYLTRRAVAVHEIRCFHNPLTRSCATCRYLHERSLPAGAKGCSKAIYLCTAENQGAVLTTNCMHWAERESYEF
jgi:hypothetical protein